MEKGIIHVVVGNFNQRRANGVTHVVRSIIPHISKLVHCKVYALSNVSAVYNLDGVSVRRFKTFHGFNWRLARQIIKTSKSNSLVYIFHGGWNLEYTFYYALILLFGGRYVVNLHGAFNEVQVNSSLNKRIYYHAVASLYLKFAHKVQVFSDRERDYLVSTIGLKNVIVIPNGIQKIVSKESVDFKTRNQRIKVCYLGRYTAWQKGLDLLIDFLSNCSPDVKESFSFHFYGEGELHDTLDSLANESNNDGFIFVNGPVFGDEKHEVLASMDCFILASRFEGMPVALLESISFGLFNFVSAATNLRDDVVLNGLGVEIDSTSNSNWASLFLSSKERIIDEREIRVERAQLLYDFKLSWENIANSLVEKIL